MDGDRRRPGGSANCQRSGRGTLGSPHRQGRGHVRRPRVGKAKAEETTMTTTMTAVADIPDIGREQAMVLAETEFARTLDLLRQLGPEEWQRPTVCALWDVRALVAHVVGMAEAQASFRQF